MIAILKNYHWIILCTLLMGTFFTGGCNQEPSPVDVSGMVTYQGKPISEGKILFADVKNSTPTAIGNIKDGHYTTQAIPGEKCVRINVSVKTGKVLDGPMGAKVEEVVDLLPSKYNMNSTLIRTVDSQDNNVLDFALE